MNLLIAAGLMEEQFAAPFARIFQLVPGADSDAVFRRYVEYLPKAALKETDQEELRFILRNAVKARKQITYVTNPEPVDNLIGKIALRAYE